MRNLPYFAIMTALIALSACQRGGSKGINVGACNPSKSVENCPKPGDADATQKQEDIYKKIGGSGIDTPAGSVLGTGNEETGGEPTEPVVADGEQAAEQAEQTEFPETKAPSADPIDEPAVAKEEFPKVETQPATETPATKTDTTPVSVTPPQVKFLIDGAPSLANLKVSFSETAVTNFKYAADPNQSVQKYAFNNATQMHEATYLKVTLNYTFDFDGATCKGDVQVEAPDNSEGTIGLTTCTK